MKTVLFVCNHNAGPPQMAEGFFERYAPEDMTMGCDTRPFVPTTVENWDIRDPASRSIQTRDRLEQDTCDVLALA